MDTVVVSPGQQQASTSIVYPMSKKANHLLTLDSPLIGFADCFLSYMIGNYKYLWRFGMLDE